MRARLLNLIASALFGALLLMYGVAVWWSSQRPPLHITTAEPSGTQIRTPHITAGANSEERLADYTWWVAAFTFALSIVSAFQIGFLIRADKTARIAANAAKESADAQKAALVSTARPRVIVRKLALARLEPNRLPTIQFALVNNGASATRIVEHNATIVVLNRDELPAVPVYHPPNTSRDEIPLESGQLHMVVSTGHEPTSQHTIEEINRFPQIGPRIYVYGYCQYRDAAGTLRHMGFCRRFDLGRRFSVVADPEYEYSD